MTTARNSPEIDCLLLDLDGVIRHFDPVTARRAEELHGLEPGTIPRVAFAPELLGRVVTGEMTRAQWIAQVGHVVGSVAAAEDWLSDRGRIDLEVMAMVGEVRRLGLTVAVLTNGTDTIEAELRHHGIDGDFDHVFNTHFIGVAKPEPRAYHHVIEYLGSGPERILFFDDRLENVAGAEAVGLRAHLFEGPESLRVELRRIGLISR